MDHMNILNDILGGGFTAPLLCDLANEKDNYHATMAAEFVKHLKQHPVITMLLPKDKDGYTTRYLKINPSHAVTAYIGGEYQLIVKVGDKQVTLCGSSGGVRAVSSFRTVDDLVGFPDHLMADIVAGRDFDAPVTISDDVEPTWSGKLKSRLGPAEVRQSIQAAIKDLLTKGVGACDVFTLRGRLVKEKRNRSSVGDISPKQWKDLARMFFKLNKNGEIDPNAVANDFGITNVDNYALAVKEICRRLAPGVEIEGCTRWNICDFNTHSEQQRRNVNAIPDLSISKIITFFGGKAK